MRLGIVSMPRAERAGREPIIDQLTMTARKVESLGFHGLWTTDSLGRGWATVDPLMMLSAACGATRKVELGTCVLQVPLRNPVELAHRVQTLNLLSAGRVRLGVGSGSTKHDFDALGLDYEARFKTLPPALETMQRVWKGEAVLGPALTVWPGTEGGPPMMLGAWRSPRWINLAAGSLQGWIASGIHTKWEDLEIGLKMFREAGGKRAVVANIFADFRKEQNLTPMIEHARISMISGEAKARETLKRLGDLGVDDALVVCPFDSPEQLETIRGLL